MVVGLSKLMKMFETNIGRKSGSSQKGKTNGSLNNPWQALSLIRAGVAAVKFLQRGDDSLGGFTIAEGAAAFCELGVGLGLVE